MEGKRSCFNLSAPLITNDHLLMDSDFFSVASAWEGSAVAFDLPTPLKACGLDRDSVV